MEIFGLMEPLYPLPYLPLTGGDEVVVPVDSAAVSLCVCIGSIVTGGYLAVFAEHVGCWHFIF